MCLKSPLSPYTMLRNHNIAWRNFCSLFLNIVKRRKGVETTSSFSHNFCHWLSEKISQIKRTILQLLVLSFYIKLKACNYPLPHNFATASHYLTVTSKTLFEMMKKLFGTVRFNISFLTYDLQVFLIDRNMGMVNPLFHNTFLIFFFFFFFF